MKAPVIYHIPHASLNIPEEYKSDYCADLDRELMQMTDWYTDDLFDLPGERLVAPVSRLVCDVERFRDDAHETMARIGMGAVYTACHDLSLLRSVSAAQREAILRAWYDPHHETLTQIAEEQLSRFGRCLIVDCHSFPPTSLPYEPDQSSERPDICIGTDPFHTPECLAQSVEVAFRSLGYAVCRNRPFAGAIVPLAFYQKDPRVNSVMIEVNRRLYMEDNGQKNCRYAAVKRDIQAALHHALPAMGDVLC